MKDDGEDCEDQTVIRAAYCRELTDEDIRTAIKNSGGVKGSLLIPDAPFELLVRRSISRLLAPCLQCKDFVHAELLRIAGQCAPPDIARFPALQACPSCCLARPTCSETTCCVDFNLIKLAAAWSDGSWCFSFLCFPDLRDSKEGRSRLHDGTTASQQAQHHQLLPCSRI